jgi:VanZ family protein
VNQQRWYFALSTGLILLLVVPWLNYEDHAHWARVAWVPFLSKEVRLRDMASNVLLYAPWGYFWVRQGREPSRHVWPVVMFAAVLSIATEASQSYSHGRFPSATDVTCNLVGAFAGASYARRNHR